MDNLSDLRVLLASRHPLLIVELDEEQRFMKLLRAVSVDLQLPMWTWSASGGLARDGREPQYRTSEPQRALRFISDLDRPGVYVFADVQPYLDDSIVVRLIKEFAQEARSGQTLVLTGPTGDVPASLRSIAHRWQLRPPDDRELTSLLKRMLHELRTRDFQVVLPAEAEAELVAALRGLTLQEAARLIQQAALDDGKISQDDIPAVRTAKAELLAAEGVLELVEEDSGVLDDVGGLDELKSWLKSRSSEQRPPGVDAPRGILMTGVPGCGKSMVAKALARTWKQPLILLDPARLYAKYVGESEQRLASALATIDAMAPAVLWIDEIEKGFASDAGDSGVSARLLGTFLRWMQDRRQGVFIVATANDVRALPPEFARKGRFDEIFFVDLPDAPSREQILRHHVEKRGIEPGELDLRDLAKQSDGFSGAELEAAVVGAFYRANGDRPTTDDLIAEIASTVPLSRARAAEVSALRAWATEHAVPA